MSPTDQYAQCPVAECTAQFDAAFGLCWRHRQLVPKPFIRAIEKEHLALERFNAPKNLDDISKGRKADAILRWNSAIRAAAAQAELWSKVHGAR